MHGSGSSRRRKSSAGPGVVVGLVILAAACGGTEFPTSAKTAVAPQPVGSHQAAPTPTNDSPTTVHRPPARPRSTTTTAPATPSTLPTAPPATGVPVPKVTTPTSGTGLESLVPYNVLGPEWADDGDPGTSLDLTNPPSQCAPFTSVFAGRTETMLHEFSYLPSADGQYERGHFNLVAIRAASPAAVLLAFGAVGQPAFAPCAEASAVRHFNESYSGTIDSVSAQPIYLTVGGPNVIWRVIIETQNSAGAHTAMRMDVGYLVSGDVLVKVRIATCGCDPATNSSELMPGELAALQHIASQLTRI